jgi:uncharacterized protein
LSDNPIPIGPDDTFRFGCSPAVSCFNECCRDLNQILYPYDILRLKKALGLSSGDFLERYTIRHTGPGSGLPIVALKTADAQRSTCPFVTAKGCRVYPDRPSSCRIYPLMRAISRCRDTGRITKRFLLLKEPHCLGFNQPEEQTVRQWIKNQDVEVYNRINDNLMEIISRKNRLYPGPLGWKSQQLFYSALYDLDHFRNQLFNDKLFANIDADPQKLAAAETDDTALLEMAMEWVKQVLFKS